MATGDIPSGTDIAIFQHLGNPDKIDLENPNEISTINSFEEDMRSRYSRSESDSMSSTSSRRSDRNSRPNSRGSYFRSRSPSAHGQEQQQGHHFNMSSLPETRRGRAPMNTQAFERNFRPPSLDSRSPSPKRTPRQQDFGLPKRTIPDHFPPVSPLTPPRESAHRPLPEAPPPASPYSHASMTQQRKFQIHEPNSNLVPDSFAYDPDDQDSQLAKIALLNRLQSNRRIHNLVPSKNYTMQDSAQYIEFELRCQQAILDQESAMAAMKKGMEMLFKGVEKGVSHFKIHPMNNYTEFMLAQMTNFEYPLERIYRKYFRKSEQNPIGQLALALFTSTLTFIFVGNVFRSSNSSSQMPSGMAGLFGGLGNLGGSGQTQRGFNPVNTPMPPPRTAPQPPQSSGNGDGGGSSILRPPTRRPTMSPTLPNPHSPPPRIVLHPDDQKKQEEILRQAEFPPVSQVLYVHTGMPQAPSPTVEPPKIEEIAPSTANSSRSDENPPTSPEQDDDNDENNSSLSGDDHDLDEFDTDDEHT